MNNNGGYDVVMLLLCLSILSTTLGCIDIDIDIPLACP